jgi:hypothetical protein
MALDGPVDVPIAWLWAEQAAEELIATSDGPLSPATFEFRATRDVLALTLFVTGIAARPGDLPARDLALIRDRLSVMSDWMAWCGSRLAGKCDRHPTNTANLRLARNAWLWLRRSRMLDGPALPGRACCDTVTSAGAGCRVGLYHARRIIAGHLI